MLQRKFGVSAIIVSSKGVLLVKRGRDPMKGRWSFPGGRLGEGESPVDGALRELSEETNLEGIPLARLGELLVPDGEIEVLIHVFAGYRHDDPDSPIPEAGDDAAEARFVPFERVLELPTTPGLSGWVARALDSLLIEKSGLSQPFDGV